MSMRWGLLICILLSSCLPALAQRERANLWCEQGGQTVTVNGVVSSTKVQKSYPSCTVTVYDTGTSNLTSLCTDAACTTPLINPFTSTSTGYITFFAQTEPAIIDVQQSGGGLATPITTRGLELCDVTTCLGGGGGGGSGSVAGTPPHIAKFTDATTVGNSVGQDDGTTPTTWPLGVSLVTNALFTVKVNNGTTGTTTNLLVARDSSGNAITAQPTDTNNLIGIAGSGAGLTGSVSIAYSGEFSCTMDNQSAIADWVILGSGGQCHDAGAVEPAGVQNIGRVASVNAGAGTLATVDLGLPDVTSPASGGGGGNGTVGPCASFPGPIAYYSALNTITCDASATLDGSGNYTGTSATYSGAASGYIAFGQGTAPTLSVANAAYWYAASSIATTFGSAFPAAPGTAGQVLTIATAPDATHITTNWQTPASPVSTACDTDNDHVCVFEEFLGGTENASLGWAKNGGGGSVAVACGQSTCGPFNVNHPGLYSVNAPGAQWEYYVVGVGNTNGEYLQPTTQTFVLSAGVQSQNSANGVIRFGMFTDRGREDQAVGGVYFESTETGTANWFCHTQSDAGVDHNADSAVSANTPSAVWHTLEIDASAAASVVFKIDGVAVCGGMTQVLPTNESTAGFEAAGKTGTGKLVADFMRINFTLSGR